MISISVGSFLIIHLKIKELPNSPSVRFFHCKTFALTFAIELNVVDSRALFLNMGFSSANSTEKQPKTVIFICKISLINTLNII